MHAAISVWQTLAGDGGMAVWDSLAINNYVKLSTVKVWRGKALGLDAASPVVSAIYSRAYPLRRHLACAGYTLSSFRKFTIVPPPRV